MRDIQSTPDMYRLTNGGKDPNYLVRSWASSLGTVTQGHKAPKSDYRSKWLQRLNRVELMQNVEVQQTLRNMMSTLKASEEILQNSDSAYEFAERRQIEKCHEVVCKIRECEMISKRSARLLTQSKDDLKTKSSSERSNVKRNKQENQTLHMNKSSLPEYNYTPKTKYFNSDDNHHTFSLPNTVLNGINNYSFFNNKNNKLYAMSMSDSKAERKVSLPPIPEGGQEKSTAVPRRRHGHQTSLPSLDANSKFSIIKRAREIRNERHADNKKQNLLSMSSQVNKKFSKARNESLQNCCRIEIFADNRKILNDKQTAVVENTGPVTLPLLDTKSFSEIDCNDYLHLKNRLDSLSPEKAVLDHKLHWPTSTKK